MHLTAAGQRFVNEAAVGAQHFTNAVGALHAVRRGQGGAVRLGMFTSLRNEFLRRPVGEYHLRHPAIECHFEEGTTQSSIGGVIDGRLDIAFVTGRPTAPGCQSVASATLCGRAQARSCSTYRGDDSALIAPGPALYRYERWPRTRCGGIYPQPAHVTRLPTRRPGSRRQLRDSSSHSGAWFWRGSRVRDRDNSGRFNRMSSAGWGVCLGAKAGPRRGRAVNSVLAQTDMRRVD